MKKLLSTTAIAGLLISGSAFAQTTITGEMRINYKGVSQDIATGTTPASGRGFGTEQQINFANKGKLNVGGLDYAAGFSIENDGAQVGTLFNENMYIDLTNASSGTTLSFSQDHIQRSDSARSNGVLFGYDPRDILDGIGTLAQDSSMLFQQNIGAAPGQSYGLGVVQTLPGFGRVSANYVPENTQAGASEANFAQNGEAESAIELGFTGDLGVKGLDIYAFKHEEKRRMGQTKKREGENYGIKYTMGKASAGYTRKEHIGSNTSVSQTEEIKENHYGVAYAVTPTLTVGANMFKADGGGTTQDAKVTTLQLGYNLGPVALTAGIAKAENVRGGTVTSEDADKIGFLRLLGAF